jgi:ketosteroid isomerase-like protein
MLSWLAKKLMAFNMARISAGDPKPALRMDAKDVTLRFPGTSSWSGEFAGKLQVATRLDRFVAVGLQIAPDEVVVKGFPWNQTICVRGRDHLRSSAGELVYENRYVIWGHLRWGLLRDYEVYEDTERANALDAWLAEREPALAIPSLPR